MVTPLIFPGDIDGDFDALTMAKNMKLSGKKSGIGPKKVKKVDACVTDVAAVLSQQLKKGCLGADLRRSLAQQLMQGVPDNGEVA